MDYQPLADPVLRRFRAELQKAYGDRIERVVLFGSRARGDARPDSDYDVAVFLRDMGSLWDELGPMSDISAAIQFDTDQMVSAKPFPAGAYAQSTPRMHELRRDGIDL